MLPQDLMPFMAIDAKKFRNCKGQLVPKPSKLAVKVMRDLNDYH
jgi:hypothetical protein